MQLQEGKAEKELIVVSKDRLKKPAYMLYMYKLTGNSCYGSGCSCPVQWGRPVQWHKRRKSECRHQSTPITNGIIWVMFHNLLTCVSYMLLYKSVSCHYSATDKSAAEVIPVLLQVWTSLVSGSKRSHLKLQVEWLHGPKERPGPGRGTELWSTQPTGGGEKRAVKYTSRYCRSNLYSTLGGGEVKFEC